MRKVAGSGRPRPARNISRNFLVCLSMAPSFWDFCKMIAHEKTERTNRMQSTTRATQPVCVISVSSRLVISNSARTEIVVPQEKSFEKTTHKHRSTRNQQGSNESIIYINPMMPITTQQFRAGTRHRQQFQLQRSELILVARAAFSPCFRCLLFRADQKNRELQTAGKQSRLRQRDNH